ncbi:MAG TPA: phosphatase PAP2 family protein [Bacteroidia bacterium]
MLHKLKKLDTDLFVWLNSGHNAFFDTVMYWASSEFFWVWLYVIFLVMVYSVYGKRTLLILPIVALMILCSDQTSNLVKNSVKRYRPCWNSEVMSKNDIHLNLPRDANDQFLMPGKHGFVSSHAANTFALAFFLSMILMKRFRYFPLFIFTWAAVVAYSRIYNGVHYPADVGGGMLVGLLCGFLAWRLWLWADEQVVQKNVSSFDRSQNE